MERLVAKKSRIADLHGKFVEKTGTTPSFVQSPQGELSRVNLIAAVIEKPTPNQIMLDDGTSKIVARTFDSTQIFENIMVGDIILLIGRPRSYQNENYVVAEIARRLNSPKWLELRKAELQHLPEQKKEAPKPIPQPMEEVITNKGDKVLALIKELDAGDGAPIEDVVAKAGFPEAENTLSSLMAEGEIFEIRPGRVKVLE